MKSVIIQKYDTPFFNTQTHDNIKKGPRYCEAPLGLGIVCLYNYLAAITRAISQTLFE